MNFNIKRDFILLFVTVVIYVSAFEFILPVNLYFPKPSILWNAAVELWEKYHLLGNIIHTVFVIYFPMILALLLVKLLLRYVIKFKNFILFKMLESKPDIFPAFLLSLIFIFWNVNSILVELVLSFLIIFFSVLKYLLNNYQKMPDKYLSFSRSLGISKKEIIGSIAFNYFLPGVFETLKSKSAILWVNIFAIEMILKADGLGGITYKLFEYNDYSAFLILLAISAFIAVFCKLILEIIDLKIIHWSMD